MMKIANEVVKYLIFILLMAVIILVLLPLIPPFKGYYHTRTVLTGSMEPNVAKGSLIINKWTKDKEIQKGDVITFRNPSSQNMFITHRIYSVDPATPLYRFITKGDANPAVDPWTITQAGLEGKVILVIPLVGYLIDFFKSPIGFIIFVVLPLGYFIGSEFFGLKKALKKNNHKDDEGDKQDKKRVETIIASMIMLVLTISMIMPTSVLAYFNTNSVQLSGIQISTANWSDSGSVVINEVYYDVGSEKGAEETNEWIELYNNTSQPIDISGWKIEDNQGLSYQRIIPSSSPIPAYRYAVITPNISTWGYWSSIPDDAIKIVLGNSIGNGLSDTGDRVILKTAGGIEVDAMSYGTDTYAFSPACPDVITGHSLSRKPAGYDTNKATDWMNTYGGSTPPGPNPGTNPHNKDGSLVLPTITPEPSVTPIVTPTPTPTEIPELSSGLLATSSATIVEPTPTPEISPTPTPTVEPSPTPVPSTTPTPSSSPEPSPEASLTPTPEPTPILTPTPSPTNE